MNSEFFFLPVTFHHNFRILLSIPCTSWPLGPLKHHPQAPSSCLKGRLMIQIFHTFLNPFFLSKKQQKKRAPKFSLYPTLSDGNSSTTKENYISTNYKHPTPPDTRGNKRKIIKLLHKFVYKLCTNCLCTQVLLQMGCASVCVCVCVCLRTDRFSSTTTRDEKGGARGGGSIYPRKKHNYPKPTF